MTSTPPLSSTSEDLLLEEFVDWESIQKKTAKTLTVKSSSGHDLVTYQIQNSVDDGFIRLYTMAGHRYWIAQAEQGHGTPDWKLHFPVQTCDLAVVWNIVSKLFIRFRCSAAMKLVNGLTKPPDFMSGRELTVYMYCHDGCYRNCHFFESGKKCTLGQQFEQPSSFWVQFINAVETAMRDAGITPGPVACGDQMLGTYCSLRNEAFVRIPKHIRVQLTEDELSFFATFRSATRDGSTYPPNQLGYNAAGHRNPFKGETHRHSIFWLLTFTILLVALAYQQFAQVEGQNATHT